MSANLISYLRLRCNAVSTICGPQAAANTLAHIRRQQQQHECKSQITCGMRRAASAFATDFSPLCRRFAPSPFSLPFLSFTPVKRFAFHFDFLLAQAPQSSLQPQINEITRNIEGFPLYASNLQLRVHIDDQRFISKSEVLELRCSADIMGLASLRRESRMRTTILALKDNGYNQRLTENGTCANARAGEFQADPMAKLIISVPYTLYLLKWMKKGECRNRDNYKIIELMQFP